MPVVDKNGLAKGRMCIKKIPPKTKRLRNFFFLLSRAKINIKSEKKIWP